MIISITLHLVILIFKRASFQTNITPLMIFKQILKLIGILATVHQSYFYERRTNGVTYDGQSRDENESNRYYETNNNIKNWDNFRHFKLSYKYAEI